MPQRDIVLESVNSQADMFRLREYLRELYTLTSPRYTTVTYGTTITVDANQAETFFLTLTGNVTTIVINNADTGRKIRFIFLQDSTGGRTVAGWPATVMLAGAALTVTSTASRYSTISFEYQNSKWIEVGRTLDVH